MKKSLFFLIAIFSVLPLMAQNAEIRVSNQTTYIGQPVQLQLVVTDGKADVPEIPESDSYSMEYRGISTAVQSSLINGKSTQTVQRLYTWLLIPRKTGKIIFPSLKIKVDGKTINTQALTLTVKEARNVEGTFVEYVIPDHKIYPGQDIPLNVVWYFSMAVSSPHYSFPFLEKDNMDFQQPPPPSRQNAELYTFNIGDKQVYAERSAALINGEQYSTLTFPWIMSVKKPGNYTLPPLGISMEISTGRRDSWMNPIYESGAIQSKEATVKVSSLPQAIKDSPTGILLSNGELKVSATLDPQIGYVGDPLTLTIEFSHGEGLQKYNMPSLGVFSNVTRNFKVPSDRSNGRYNNEVLTFTQTIRPKSEESTLFPAMEFLYLDISNGELKKASTQPIPINIQTSSVVNSNDIEQLGEGEKRINKAGLEEHAEGISAFIPWKKLKNRGILGVQRSRILLYIILALFPLIPALFLIAVKILKKTAEMRGSSYSSYKKRIQGYTHGDITLSEMEQLLLELEKRMPPNPHSPGLREKLQEVRFSGLSGKTSHELDTSLEALFNFWEEM